MSQTRRRPHEEEEEHTNHERWLITYADMVTLLMVLFIVMFAISQVDQKKFAELRDGLSAGFGSEDSLLTGQSAITSEMGNSPAAPQLQLAKLDDEQRKLVQQALEESARLEKDRIDADAKNEYNRLEGVRKKLMEALRRAGLADDVRATYDARGLVISLVSKHVTFRSDRAELTPRGLHLVDAIGGVLRTIADPIEIDGHTNQAPGRPKYYETDWQLSAVRALTVLDRLQQVSALPANRLSMAAFGHTRPLMDPAKPGSQEINKRVDIVVRARTDADASRLLPDLAKGLNTGDATGAPANADAAAQPGTNGDDEVALPATTTNAAPAGGNR